MKFYVVNETRIRRSLLWTIFATGIALVVANDLLRRFVFSGDGLGTTLMGSVPNFVAALTGPALILVDIQSRKIFSSFTNKALGIFSGIVIFVLVAFYEFSQSITPGATMDTNDVLATTAGTIGWLLVWPFVCKAIARHLTDQSSGRGTRAADFRR